MVLKRILCLANSRKLHGRCIAGKEIRDHQPGAWVRPVSAREHEEVSEYERQYEDGSDPRVLDVIDVHLVEARPKAYQQENWLLDPTHYWRRVGSLEWRHLEKFVDPAGALWIDGHSTFPGLNDKIPLELAGTLTSSLRLIAVEDLKLVVFAPSEAFGNPKRRVQAHFRHHGENYRLWITDPGYERTYLARPDGEHSLGTAYLTVSLGEPHNQACYKLVAGIFEPPGAQR